MGRYVHVQYAPLTLQRNFTGGSAHAVLTSGGERQLSDLPTVATHASEGESDYPTEKASM